MNTPCIWSKIVLNPTAQNLMEKLQDLLVMQRALVFTRQKILVPSVTLALL